MTSRHAIRVYARGGVFRHLERAIYARSTVIGLSLAVARFFMLLAIVMFVLWSYSVWGSESTPLRYLLVPGLVFAGVSIIIRGGLVGWLRWTRRAARLHERRTMSRAVRRLRDER